MHERISTSNRSSIGAGKNHLRFDYVSEVVDVLNVLLNTVLEIFRPSVVTAFYRNLSLWPVAMLPATACATSHFGFRDLWIFSHWLLQRLP